MPKRVKVDNASPVPAAPQMPVIDGYDSSSGGSFRDDFDDAAITKSIESANDIDTPVGSRHLSPVLSHAPDADVAHLSTCC